MPAQLRVIVTVPPDTPAEPASGAAFRASAPAQLIEGGLPTEGAIAHMLVS